MEALIDSFRLSIDQVNAPDRQNSLCALHAHDDVRGTLKPLFCDRPLALSALPVSPLVHPFQRILDTQQLVLLSPPQFKGHLLVLHGVHTGEPANGGVQFHDIGGILARVESFVNFLGKGFQSFAEL